MKVAILKNKNNNEQDKIKELLITNITYPYNKFVLKHYYYYFPQSNILIYGCEYNFKVWNIDKDQLVENDNLENLFNKFDKILFMERYDIVIGIYRKLCQIIHIQKQSISYQTNLKLNVKQQLNGCQSILQNLLCFGDMRYNRKYNRIFLFNIKQDKLKSQLFLKTNDYTLQQQKYIMIINNREKQHLMIQISNKYKLFRRRKHIKYCLECYFNQKNYLQMEFSIRSHYVLDITNMKIKLIIQDPHIQFYDQIYIESLDILIKVFKNKIVFCDKEYKQINQLIYPYCKLNKTCPIKLGYNEKQGLIIFHSK